MDRFREPPFIFRILIPVVLIALLGISPRPFSETEALRKAQIAVKAGDHLAAAKLYARAAEHHPEHSDLWKLAASEAFLGEGFQQAIDIYQRLIQMEAIDEISMLNLGDAYAGVGEIKSAMDVWVQLPYSAQAHARLADAYQQAGDLDAAADELRAQVALEPGRAALAYQTGLLLTATDPDAALVYLSQAGDLDPEIRTITNEYISAIRTANLFDEPAYTLLAAGRELAAHREWELAAEAFSRAVELRADYAEAWAYLGEARLQFTTDEGTSSEPPKELLKAYELDPRSLSANLFLASFYRKQRDFDQAQEYLENAHKIDPQNTVVLTESGATLAAAGDLSSAQAAYEEAVNIDPDNPVPWRSLAEFSLAYDVQVREIALPSAREAVILAPRDPLSLDLLGQTLYTLEDYLNAERVLKEAVALDSNLASAHLHLGMVYLVQGKWWDARDELRLSAELAPSTAIETTANRLLDRYFR